MGREKWDVGAEKMEGSREWEDGGRNGEGEDGGGNGESRMEGKWEAEWGREDGGEVGRGRVDGRMGWGE